MKIDVDLKILHQKLYVPCTEQKRNAELYSCYVNLLHITFLWIHKLLREILIRSPNFLVYLTYEVQEYNYKKGKKKDFFR